MKSPIRIQNYRHWANSALGSSLRNIVFFLTAATFCASTAAQLSAGEFVMQILHEFVEMDNGNAPSGLIQGHDGYLYGTTANGDAWTGGTIFKMAPGGDFKTIFSAPNPSTPNSMPSPVTTLLQGKDGYLYGVSGFNYSDSWQSIFRMTTNGDLCFSLGPPLGGAIGLVEALDGNSFYGASYKGGHVPNGWLFRLDHLGSLVSFGSISTNSPELDPWSIVLGQNGSLYFTASAGGFHAGNGSLLLKEDPDLDPVVVDTSLVPGLVFNLLLAGSDGNIYGTARSANDGQSTWFKLASDGRMTLLPWPASSASVAFQGLDGNIYGITADTNKSTIFKLSSNGLLTTTKTLPASLGGFNEADPDLAPFSGVDPGHTRSLLQGSDGLLYGIVRAIPGAIFRLVEPPILRRRNRQRVMSWSHGIRSRTAPIGWNTNRR